MVTVRVSLQEQRDASYDIVIGRGLLAELPALLARHCPAARYAVITDSHVAKLLGPTVMAGIRSAGVGAALFEFPASAQDDPTYLYYSTFHWQSLVNGYSGFFPPSYVRLMDSMQTFPDDSSIGALRARGTRYVVVHGERLFGDRYEIVIAALDRRADLVRVSRHPWYDRDKHSEITAYRLVYR